MTEHESKGAVFPLVRLRPEQTAGCLVQSARLKEIDDSSSMLVQLMKFGNTNDFVSRYGDVGEDEFGTDSVTVTQRLLMLNGSLVREQIEDNPVLNASSHIRMFARDAAQAVELVFLAVLNRYPTELEREQFTTRVQETDKLGEAIEDLYWVLVNSTEFSWNH
jgi:hypothetical protein